MKTRDNRKTLSIPVIIKIRKEMASKRILKKTGKTHENKLVPAGLTMQAQCDRYVNEQNKPNK